MIGIYVHIDLGGPIARDGEIQGNRKPIVDIIGDIDRTHVLNLARVAGLKKCPIRDEIPHHGIVGCRDHGPIQKIMGKFKLIGGLRLYPWIPSVIRVRVAVILDRIECQIIGSVNPSTKGK
jgi:hypothetical protein